MPEKQQRPSTFLSGLPSTLAIHFDKLKKDPLLFKFPTPEKYEGMNKRQFEDNVHH